MRKEHAMIPRFARKDKTRYGKRHKPGEMNQTEMAYADFLHARTLTGEVLQWHFEAVTFKIAPDCRYTPDFCVYLANGEMEFVDAKGGGPVDEKSTVKLRTAAEKFPQFRFVQEKKRPKRDGGGFERREF